MMLSGYCSMVIELFNFHRMLWLFDVLDISFNTLVYEIDYVIAVFLIRSWFENEDTF